MHQIYSDQFGNAEEPIDLSELQKLRFMQYSTKVTWLVNFLHQLLNENTSEKIVIVSQFVDVIQKISEALGNARLAFHTCRFNRSSQCT
jgi:hypothetical protein